MSKEFILAITDHRKFGIIIAPYIITPSQGNSFYSTIEKANAININDVTIKSDYYNRIIKLIDEYDDMYLAKLFSKKKEQAQDFLNNATDQFIEERIKPHIERKILEIINIIKANPTRIFLKDRKYSKIYRSDEISLAGPTAEAVFHFIRNENGIQYFLSISHNNKQILLRNAKGTFLTQTPCNLILNQILYSFDNIDSKKLQPFFEKDYINIPKQTEQTYFEKFVLNTIKQFKVEAEGFKIREEKPKGKTILYLQNDLKGVPVLLLKFRYGQKVILPNNREQFFVILEQQNDEFCFIKTLRDILWETAVFDNLNKFGIESKDNIHFYPKITNNPNDSEAIYQMINWLNLNSQMIDGMGIEIRQDFFPLHYSVAPINLELSIDDSNDWFDIQGIVEFGSFKIPFIRLRKHILKHIREYELPDGTIAILPAEWFVRYKDIFLFSEHSQHELRLNKFHFGLLNSEQTGIDKARYQQILELFTSDFTKDQLVPSEIVATLRPYQLTGFNWMNRLRQHHLGGCLADDMGLGKTLQTLALLLETSKDKITEHHFHEPVEKKQLSLFDEPVEQKINAKKSPTSLIVLPASLVHNWQNEIKKFTPQLRSFVHAGNNRTKDLSTFNRFDIILTTYGVIRNDYEWLALYPFHYLILDESQVIKNPDSKIYKSVIQLKSTHKLVLTGTPIENSLIDLWSQMNFINRGLLGNYTFFKNEFVNPIEKNGDEIKSRKLLALIHPFLLRRTKDQVAKDLPPRTDYIRYCDMSETQRKIYEEEKSAIRNTILESLEKKGVEKSAMLILQALTKLRQLANHPRLIGLNEDSGKFDEVTRVLENLIAEKHKVLIFSSFVKHLWLFEEFLKNNNIQYSLLTGQTRNREQVIDAFQNNPENQVFLISLKAGGVGLNLTAADYVFMLDPWWNPAAENQAINRAHRIGQDKKVFVYRFITSETIEEKIVQLQERKSELANQFVNSNNPFKDLSPEKIKELFD